MKFDYDLFIIGAGPGGTAAARRAAAYGVRVAVAEQEDIGGTCTNRGCIPKKLIVYAADFTLRDRLAHSYGWSECAKQFDWSLLIRRIHQHVESVRQSYLKKFEQAGIELLRGRATFVDAHTVEINGRKVTADKILIAVGGHSIKPDIPGSEYAITSRKMFELKELPQRLAIIGGGYIGVEFSSMMNGLGVQVTLLDKDELILDGFDRDVRSAVQDGLSKRGIRLISKVTVEEIKQVADGLQLSLSGDSAEIITADTILFATGRAPNTKNLKLENAGVEVGEKGAIEVDEFSRTTQDNIYAVGDCTNRVQLTPIARAEGRAFADVVFGDKQKKVDYEHFTSAVFARPEAATVGMTEEKARSNGYEVQCHRSYVEQLFYSFADQDDLALIKLVVDADTDKVLGAHMVGEHAAEIIQSLAVAIAQGLTKENIDRTIGIHPTIAEEFLTLD